MLALKILIYALVNCGFSGFAFLKLPLFIHSPSGLFCRHARPQNPHRRYSMLRFLEPTTPQKKEGNPKVALVYISIN